jgi:hypothetical protein
MLVHDPPRGITQGASSSYSPTTSHVRQHFHQDSTTGKWSTGEAVAGSGLHVPRLSILYSCPEGIELTSFSRGALVFQRVTYNNKFILCSLSYFMSLDNSLSTSESFLAQLVVKEISLKMFDLRFHTPKFPLFLP